MNSSNHRPRPLTGLLLGLAAILIVADQLSKAWFVYLLGSHQTDGFGEFCTNYFSLWVADPRGSGIIENYFPFRPPIPVYDIWIQFNLTTNNGAAWSIFANNSFALSFVSLAMAGILYYVWHRNFRYHTGMTWALGGIIGGALGNFFDRFRLKEVVDFIDVKIPYIGRLFAGMRDPYDFPIFNVADSAAVCGTIALAVYLLVVDIRGYRQRRRERSLPPPPSPFPNGHGLVVDPEVIEGIKSGAIRPEQPADAQPESDSGVESEPPEAVQWNSGEAENGSKRARESAEN